eukprot:8395261-Pyramimonas_sp.AAC.1
MSRGRLWTGRPLGTRTDPVCTTLGRGAQREPGAPRVPSSPGTPGAPACRARGVRQMRHVLHVRQ